MSATNRGAERRDSDFYPTPLSAFEPLIPFITRENWPEVWEPASGDNRLIYAMRDAAICAGGNDLTNGYDFLKDTTHRHCIVTNPPYSLALEFCQHAVAHASAVYLLLRLNFLASKKRREWFTYNEPAALFVLSERPKFVNGCSDSCDYAWFYWRDNPKWRGVYHL